MQSIRVCMMLAVGVTGLTGCGRHSKSEVYYMISTNQALPYWKTLDAGFNKAAAEYGVTATIKGPDGFDAKGEAEEFRHAAAMRPAGILISVADAGLLRDDINAAVSAGVPVITVDSDAPTSSRLYFIGTNNLEAGRLGAQRLVDKLGGKGNVVFFSFKNQPNLDERLQGYVDTLNEHPGMKVVDVYDVKNGADAAFDKTREYVARTGAEKIDAFVCLDSSSGKQVADVLQREHAVDRVVIAMDVDTDTLNLIKAGQVEATVSQKPYTMGYVGLQALDTVRHNKPQQFLPNYQVNSFSPFPVFVDTGTSLVDKMNVDMFLKSAQDSQ